MTAQQVVDLMNEALNTDRDAINALVANRVPCNVAMAKHPTIVVSQPAPKRWTVGLLGILNGIAELDGERIESILADARAGELGTRWVTGFRLAPKAATRGAAPAPAPVGAPR